MGGKRTGKPNGRPKVVWTPQQYKDFEKLCEIHCTNNEACGWFELDEETLDQVLKAKYGQGFSEVFPRFAAAGKVSLRRQLFIQAFGKKVEVLNKKGKVVKVIDIPPDFRAMKWLSTNHLGMTEKVAQKIEVEERRVVKVDLSWADEDTGNSLGNQDADKDATPKEIRQKPDEV